MPSVQQRVSAWQATVRAAIPAALVTDADTAASAARRARPWLSGLPWPADVGDPQPGAMYESKAFTASGIAARWAGHYTPGGQGMTGDKGYQGTGLITPMKKQPISRNLPIPRSTVSERLWNAPSRI